MFQTEPFIVPPPPPPVSVRTPIANQDERDEPFTPPSLSAYYDPPLAPTPRRLVNIPASLSRSSSSGGDSSLRAFLESLPYSRDANVVDDEVMGLIAAGNQPRNQPRRDNDNVTASTESSAIASVGHPEKQALLERDLQRERSLLQTPPILPSTSPPPPLLHPQPYHARPTALRTPSGLHIHTILIPQPYNDNSNRLPPPAPLVSPTRVTRDSEDFSPEPVEASPNPFGEEVEEIPPTYSSLRAVSTRARGGDIAEKERGQDTEQYHRYSALEGMSMLREEGGTAAGTALPSRVWDDLAASEPPSPGAVSLTRSNALLRPRSRAGQGEGRTLSRSGTLLSSGHGHGHGHSASDVSHNTTATSRSHAYNGSQGSSQLSQGQSSGANASLGHDGHTR